MKDFAAICKGKQLIRQEVASLFIEVNAAFSLNLEVGG